MSYELLYTSAPKGLKPGSRGFCTVVSTNGFPPMLQERLESLSGYSRLYPPGDPQESQNPVVLSHLKLPDRRGQVSVLSRNAAAGLDYSNRTNNIAHHVVLESHERPQAGPAWVLSQPSMMNTQWDGQVKMLPQGRPLPDGHVPPSVAVNWERVTGDAGWAGVLADAAMNDSSKLAILLFNPGQQLLPLFAEAIALLPASMRWDVTFSTYYKGVPPDVRCAWRGIIKGSAEETASRRLPGALIIDLTAPQKLTQSGPLIQAARTGQAVAAPTIAVPQPIVPPPLRKSVGKEPKPPLPTEADPYRLAMEEDRQREISTAAPIPSDRPPLLPPSHPRSAKSGKSAFPGGLVGIAVSLMLLVSLGAVAGLTWWKNREATPEQSGKPTTVIADTSVDPQPAPRGNGNAKSTSPEVVRPIPPVAKGDAWLLPPEGKGELEIDEGGHVNLIELVKKYYSDDFKGNPQFKFSEFKFPPPWNVKLSENFTEFTVKELPLEGTETLLTVTGEVEFTAEIQQGSKGSIRQFRINLKVNRNRPKVNEFDDQWFSKRKDGQRLKSIFLEHVDAVKQKIRKEKFRGELKFVIPEQKNQPGFELLFKQSEQPWIYNLWEIKPTRVEHTELIDQARNGNISLGWYNFFKEGNSVGPELVPETKEENQNGPIEWVDYYRSSDAPKLTVRRGEQNGWVLTRGGKEENNRLLLWYENLSYSKQAGWEDFVNHGQQRAFIESSLIHVAPNRVLLLAPPKTLPFNRPNTRTVNPVFSWTMDNNELEAPSEGLGPISHWRLFFVFGKPESAGQLPFKEELKPDRQAMQEFPGWIFRLQLNEPQKAEKNPSLQLLSRLKVEFKEKTEPGDMKKLHISLRFPKETKVPEVEEAVKEFDRKLRPIAIGYREIEGPFTDAPEQETRRLWLAHMIVGGDAEKLEHFAKTHPDRLISPH